MANKFCTKCGSAVVAGKRFCTKCGQPIMGSTATAGAIDAVTGSTPLQKASGALASIPAVSIESSTTADVSGPGEKALASKSSASKLCTQCGSTILAGKRFCTQCGKPVSETAQPSEPSAAILEEWIMPPPPSELISPVVPEPKSKPSATETAPIPLGEPVTITELSVPSSPVVAEMSCTRCGIPLIAGKRFCLQCGMPVANVAPPLEFATTSTEKAVPTPPNHSESTPVFVLEPELNGPVSVVETPAPVATVDIPPPPPKEAVDAGTPATALVDELSAAPQTSPIVVERPASPQEEPEPAETAIPASGPELVASTRPIPTPAPEVNDSVASDPPDTKTPDQKSSWRLPALVSVAALCVLGAAVGGFWWHTSHAKATPPSAASAPPPATAATPTPVPDSISPTHDAVVSDKPSATKPSAAVAESEPRPSPVPAKIAINKPRVDSGDETLANVPVPSIQRDSAIRQPQPPSPEPVPAKPTSGTLHYSGPPVRYGESIFFPNLPHDRLRFTFDHQSWQPLITHQQDGTQKLTLISIRRGEEQSHCDVGWEIVK
jgi:hypothetical protein